MSSPRSHAEGVVITPGLPAEREAETPGGLLTDVAAGSVAQVVLAVTGVLAVCYVAKLVMITIASALLLAFVLEPIVWHLERWRVPRAAGSFMAVTLLLGCVYGVSHVSYNSAAAFLHDLPKYSSQLHGTMLRFRQQAEQLQQTTATVLPESQQDREVVKVRAQSNWTDWLTRSASGITELLVTLSFMPFLVYFMLSWKDRTRAATVKLFSPANRHTADETLGGIEAGGGVGVADHDFAKHSAIVEDAGLLEQFGRLGSILLFIEGAALRGQRGCSCQQHGPRRKRAAQLRTS